MDICYQCWEQEQKEQAAEELFLIDLDKKLAQAEIDEET
jgi:hypothetical protein